MGMPATKLGDQVTASDIHIVMIPSPGGSVPAPLPNPFAGIINGIVSQDVMISGDASKSGLFHGFFFFVRLD
jgi:hypothetical protein